MSASGRGCRPFAHLPGRSQTEDGEARHPTRTRDPSAGLRASALRRVPTVLLEHIATDAESSGGTTSSSTAATSRPSSETSPADRTTTCLPAAVDHVSSRVRTPERRRGRHGVAQPAVGGRATLRRGGSSRSRWNAAMNVLGASAGWPSSNVPRIHEAVADGEGRLCPRYRRSENLVSTSRHGSRGYVRSRSGKRRRFKTDAFRCRTDALPDASNELDVSSPSL